MHFKKFIIFLFVVSASLTSHLLHASTEGDQQSVFYVSYHSIFPAQIRYSSQNVEEKISKAISQETAIHSKEGDWTFKYHEGTSILSEKQALPIVLAPFGYVLTDGHHDVLSSIHFGAEMIPIKIIADLSALDYEAFWKEAENRGWAYLYAIGGNRSLPPVDFSELVDDSNRYFAAITARKFPDGLGSSESFGAEYPLWIKIGKDIPFIEFKIADALWAKGFIYDAEAMGDPPRVEDVEFARKILQESPVEGLRFVPERMHYSEVCLSTSLER